MKVASQETTNDDIYEEVFVHLQPHSPNYEYERARLENQNDDRGTLVTGVLNTQKKPIPPPKPSKLVRKNKKKIAGEFNEFNFKGM